MAVAVAAMTLLSGYRGVATETIRISGTGGALGTVRFLGEAFQKSNPGFRVEVLPGMGSGGAVKAVLAGRLDIGLTARALSPEERAQGLEESRYARTPFVFAVNTGLKMTGLALDEVAGIYSGERDWESNKRIRLILRPGQDTDIPILKSMSPAMDAAVDIALAREGLIIATTDHEAAEAIENVPGAFGATTLSLFLAEKRDFRILSLNGVKPGVGSMNNRSYPFSKTFFMVTRKKPSGTVRRFIDFVRSPAGAGILSKYGQAPMRHQGIPP